ncbi:DUF2992 family protein [Bacillus halotolerans]|uniref:DUF2992 family protein n=1 Tax=Bacillus halotolerans TaxID=260554 RepID=UPI002282AF78|nr:DUF2992 family protein [Bacillus halotolerans]MCY8978074.1 DUF2992 family protein [Bacillus halotolerans]MEC1663386.1 DUF2992 family protein [Bacillus halotolerans]
MKNGKLKASQHLFGKEPKDSEVLDFVNRQLLKTLSQSEQEGVSVKAQDQKKINPKRLQRQVSKELKRAGASLKALDAMEQELEGEEAKEKTYNERTTRKNKRTKVSHQKAKS